MNNIFKKVVIIFAAIIMTCPIIKAEEATDSAINETIVVDEIVIVDDAALPQNNSEVVAANQEFNQIKLNFSFDHNKKNFVKAIDILLIGFSIVFIVMILFMFVGQGIDKMFPYKKEEED